MCVNAEVIAVGRQGGLTICESTDRGVCAPADMFNLRIHSKIPAKAWDSPGYAGELVPKCNEKLEDRIIPSPCPFVVSRHLKFVRLYVDAQKGRNARRLRRSHTFPLCRRSNLTLGCELQQY